jgi:hypothetical protein
MKLRVLVHLEGKELVAQCLEYDISARASSFAMLRHTFQLNFTARVVLAKDQLSNGETAKIQIERWPREQFKKAFPLADLMKIKDFVVEFAIL